MNPLDGRNQILRVPHPPSENHLAGEETVDVLKWFHIGHSPALIPAPKKAPGSELIQLPGARFKSVVDHICNGQLINRFIRHQCWIYWLCCSVCCKFTITIGIDNTSDFKVSTELYCYNGIRPPNFTFWFPQRRCFTRIYISRCLRKSAWLWNVPSFFVFAALWILFAWNVHTVHRLILNLCRFDAFEVAYHFCMSFSSQLFRGLFWLLGRVFWFFIFFVSACEGKNQAGKKDRNCYSLHWFTCVLLRLTASGITSCATINQWKNIFTQ